MSCALREADAHIMVSNTLTTAYPNTASFQSQPNNVLNDCMIGLKMEFRQLTYFVEQDVQ
jgi:hypothetical protein